jgi:hypothetical protein
VVVARKDNPISVSGHTVGSAPNVLSGTRLTRTDDLCQIGGLVIWGCPTRVTILIASLAGTQVPLACLRSLASLTRMPTVIGHAVIDVLCRHGWGGVVHVFRGREALLRVQ